MRRLLLVVTATLAWTAPAPAFDLGRELENYAKQNERGALDFDQPAREWATNVDRMSA